MNENKLIFNAQILTLDQDLPYAEAALILGEYFAFVGSEEEARSYIKEKGYEVQEIDAKKMLLAPSFNDSHMHFLHCVRAKRSVDLFDATSLKEVLERIKHAVEQHDPENPLWISGEGWNQDYFTDEKRFPNKHDLDAISKDVPILLMRACFHIGVLNSKALEATGLLEGQIEELGDLIEIGDDGLPTGIVRESLFDDIKGKMPAPRLDDLFKDLIDSQKDLFKHGITSIQSDDVKYVPGEDLENFYTKLGEASRKGELKVRYGLQVLVDHLPSLEKTLATGIHNFHVGRVKFNCIKILTDGSLGARTAAMRQDYADAEGERGIYLFSDEELNDMVALSHKNNLPVALHAIGDGAMEQCLNAIERAKLLYPHVSPRHGIVHAQITDRKLLERMKELDVTILSQPIFVSYDMHIVKERVGEELASSSYAWKSMMDLGICCSLGTDAPVEPFAAIPNIYCAVTRRDLSGRGPYLPEEALTVEEAIRGYSYESAYVENQESIKGKIRPGYLADFIFTDEDFLERKEDLLDAKIIQTYVGGECVYSLE